MNDTQETFHFVCFGPIFCLRVSPFLSLVIEKTLGTQLLTETIMWLTVWQVLSDSIAVANVDLFQQFWRSTTRRLSRTLFLYVCFHQDDSASFQNASVWQDYDGHNRKQFCLTNTVSCEGFTQRLVSVLLSSDPETVLVKHCDQCRWLQRPVLHFCPWRYDMMTRANYRGSKVLTRRELVDAEAVRVR